MKQSSLLKILQILTKYAKAEDELSCDDYSIFMSPGHKNISEKDRDDLENLGVMWNVEFQCWQVFF